MFGLVGPVRSSTLGDEPVSEYEAVYEARMSKEQIAACKERFGSAVEVEDRFGGVSTTSVSITPNGRMNSRTGAKRTASP
jgi:hypothetical protein